MTTIDQARRRSTDEILNAAMEESGNADPRKVAEGGRPLHYDSLDGLAVHRGATRPTNGDAGLQTLETGAGEVGGVGVDTLVDKAVGAMASAAARGAAGAAWQAVSLGTLAYHLYADGYEKPHREKDRQLALGASDAGVNGLAQALPFDESFKRAVSAAHGGSGNAAAGVASRLAQPEHRAELAELHLRAERGLVDAAPLARAAAHDIAACVRGAASASSHAKTARASGDLVAATHFEERASQALAHAAGLEKSALAPLLARAHADAAYGLGVQSAMHHALRVELGNEPFEHFAAAVARARADVAAASPGPFTVKG
jgi:hypothetical protein